MNKDRQPSYEKKGEHGLKGSCKGERRMNRRERAKREEPRITIYTQERKGEEKKITLTIKRVRKVT